MTEPARSRLREVGSRLWQQLPLLLVLVALWMLLWGEITPISVLSGGVVAIAVTRVFFLPPVELSGRFNPFWLVVLLVRFAAQLTAASVLVAGQAFAPARLPHGAVIEVPLRTRSDFVMTVTAIIATLVPGTLVVDIDRGRSRLFLHVLAARDADGVERARRSILAIEVAVVQAIGSRDDLERVRR